MFSSSFPFAQTCLPYKLQVSLSDISTLKVASSLHKQHTDDDEFASHWSWSRWYICRTAGTLPTSDHSWRTYLIIFANPGTDEQQNV